MVAKFKLQRRHFERIAQAVREAAQLAKDAGTPFSEVQMFALVGALGRMCREAAAPQVGAYGGFDHDRFYSACRGEKHAP